jgi:hypothetical protein
LATMPPFLEGMCSPFALFPPLGEFLLNLRTEWRGRILCVKALSAPRWLSVQCPQQPWTWRCPSPHTVHLRSLTGCEQCA